MDLSKTKSLQIPEGDVKTIRMNGECVWRKRYECNLCAVPEGWGSISKSRDTACHGTVMSLTANPSDEGSYEFDRWSDGGERIHSVQVYGDIDLTAYFKEVITEFLKMTSTAGNEYWYDSTSLPTPGILAYVNSSKTVQKPFSDNSELSVFNSVRSVKDYGLWISSIGNYAFYYCKNLSSIECPNVSSIGNYAFYHCENLSSIECPNVSSIGDYAFDYCTNLSSVECPSVSSIGDSAFYDCTSLSSIECSSVTSIGKNAFHSCAHLASIECPNVSSIGYDAFSYCTNLISIECPNVTIIGDGTFGSCTGLTSMECPNASSIGEYAFYHCENLSSIECHNVQDIGRCAFYWCKNLSSIECPNVSSIGNYAFYDCTSLSSIECSSVTSIGDSAFHNCAHLTSIECPNVSSIGEGVFYNCTRISSVYITNMKRDNITTLGGTGAFGDARDWPVSVYVPLSCHDLILENKTWEKLNTDDVIQLVTVPQSNTFKITSTSGNEYSYDYTSLPTQGSLVYVNSSRHVQKPFSDNSELSVFDSVRSVKDEGLGMSSIGEYAFYHCENLSSIECHNVQDIGRCAFYWCKNLSSIECHNAQSIGIFAFSYCTNLTSIECPNVSSIGDSAFDDCTSLSTFEVSLANENFTLLDENNERKKNGIVLIDENNKNVIWGSAPMCKNVVLPNYVTSVGYGAFFNCTHLTSIECPNVSSIDLVAFDSCTNLTSIECPNVTSIESDAFERCANLSSVYITGMTQDNITILGAKDAFGGAREWPVSVYIPLSCYESILKDDKWKALTTGTKPVINLIKVS